MTKQGNKKMLTMIWPIALIVVANVFYNIATKSVPANSNAFLGLACTYGVSAVACFIIFLVNTRGRVAGEFGKLNWATFVLGVVIIGLELGYVLAYRAGWKVSLAPLVANIALAVVLVIVGALLYKEHIGLRQIAGIVVCIGGLLLVSL